MKKEFIKGFAKKAVAVLSIAVVLVFGFSYVSKALAAGGAVWTTTGSCGEPQNINSYAIGETVFINGSGFAPGDYDWDITGKPGGASADPNIAVASGQFTVDESGAFCFDAYEIAGDDDGEYGVNFGNKKDNYNVDGVPPVVDLCTNLDGDQETIPDGYEDINGDGTCTEIPVVVDLCTNLDGDQETIPDGFEDPDQDGICTEIVVEDPIDLCTNIDGNQETIPANFEDPDQDGICTEVADPVDLCTNFEGDQTTIPDGYEDPDQDGICTAVVVEEDPIDLCTNIDGNQDAIPDGFEDPDQDGICTEVVVEEDPQDPDDTLGAYCGDGVINQDWEMCDSTEGCTEQCQPTDQCTEMVFAKVNANNYLNIGSGDFMPRVYLGQGTSYIPTGVWFLLSDGVTPSVDSDLSNYQDVPGFAVQRGNGFLRVNVYGNHEDLSGEMVKGTVEFFNTDALSSASDSDFNKMEFSDGLFSDALGDNGVDTVVYEIHARPQADGFYVRYSATEGQCSDDDGGDNGGGGGDTTTDLCTNIDGDQTTIPDGFEDPDQDGICTESSSGSDDTTGGGGGGGGSSSGSRNTSSSSDSGEVLGESTTAGEVLGDTLAQTGSDSTGFIVLSLVFLGLVFATRKFSFLA